MNMNNRNKTNHSLIRRWLLFCLTVMLVLSAAGITFAASKTSSGSSRNGHMSWEEFFAAWADGEFEDDESAEDGQDEIYGDIENAADGEEEVLVEEDGTYTSKEEVAAYLYEFEHLPDNYITKKEARALGWDSSAGNLDEVAPGMSIGGDYFGNYEGNLPEERNRDYYECDIDYTGGYRGAKRIIYSNDGLIYYTEDHYKTFELLYGEE